ncbi:MAG: amidohydrolase family protein [Gemmatimonadota bacterium]
MIRRFKGALPLLLMVFGVTAPLAAQYMPSQAPKPPPFFAIENVRIVTGTGAVIDNGTVVVANGLIEAVGDDVTVPGDAWVIDGAGLTVYPGLFDALSQVGLESSGPPGGGTRPGGGGNPFAAPSGPRSDGPEDRAMTTPWLDAADMLDAESEAIVKWREGGFTGAMVAPDEGIVTGQGAVVNFAGDRQKMVVKTPAALRVTMNGAGFRSYPGSLMGVIAYIKQLYLDADYQSTYGAAYDANPRGQPRPTYDRALGPIQASIAGGWPTVMPADEVREIRRVIKLGRDTGASAVIAGAHEAYEIADEVAAAGVPVLVDLDWPEADRNADPEADVALSTLRRRAYAPTTPARLEEAGASWAFYSGGLGSPKQALGKVREAMEHGLSEDAALRALTIAPARIYGVDQIIGTVEVGKLANLVLTDGPIFDEGTKIRMVFVDGLKFEEVVDERPTAPPAVDMTGTWTLSLNNDSQEATAELVMAEDGTLSGTIRGERGEQQITDGWVSGNDFMIVANASMGPRGQVEIVYTGSVDGNEIEGSASFGGRRTMDFTGIRPGGAR